MFKGKFFNYLTIRREWMAYRQMYHAMVSVDLAARALKEKCVSGDEIRWMGTWSI